MSPLMSVNPVPESHKRPFQRTAYAANESLSEDDSLPSLSGTSPSECSATSWSPTLRSDWPTQNGKRPSQRQTGCVAGWIFKSVCGRRNEFVTSEGSFPGWNAHGVRFNEIRFKTVRSDGRRVVVSAEVLVPFRMTGGKEFQDLQTETSIGKAHCCLLQSVLESKLMPVYSLARWRGG